MPRVVPMDRLTQISGNYNYVVLENGQLVVGKTGHTSLTSGNAVQAAGELRLYNGNVKWFDNASGHYQPTGDAIGSIAEKALIDAGLKASGKYVPKVWVFDSKLPRGGKWVPAE
ncbi:hypothetical protein [Aliikangiella maris]|uniref:Uncharacterized protein n=2 Tax=Aliikangiella maris TaxID=3162458 RepID=A0ABV3MSX1_9GAMM